MISFRSCMCGILKFFVFNTLVVKEQNAMKIRFRYKSENKLNRVIRKVRN